jgi:hypothetical protein
VIDKKEKETHKNVEKETKKTKIVARERQKETRQNVKILFLKEIDVQVNFLAPRQPLTKY